MIITKIFEDKIPLLTNHGGKEPSFIKTEDSPNLFENFWEKAPKIKSNIYGPINLYILKFLSNFSKLNLTQ